MADNKNMLNELDLRRVLAELDETHANTRKLNTQDKTLSRQHDWHIAGIVIGAMGAMAALILASVGVMRILF